MDFFNVEIAAELQFYTLPLELVGLTMATICGFFSLLERTAATATIDEISGIGRVIGAIWAVFIR